jgi:hypothetical protein
MQTCARNDSGIVQLRERWLGLFGQIFRFNEWICHWVANRMTACLESSFLSDGLRVANR